MEMHNNCEMFFCHLLPKYNNYRMRSYGAYAVYCACQTRVV